MIYSGYLCWLPFLLISILANPILVVKTEYEYETVESTAYTTLLIAGFSPTFLSDSAVETSIGEVAKEVASTSVDNFDEVISETFSQDIAEFQELASEFSPGVTILSAGNDFEYVSTEFQEDSSTQVIEFSLALSSTAAVFSATPVSSAITLSSAIATTSAVTIASSVEQSTFAEADSVDTTTSESTSLSTPASSTSTSASASSSTSLASELIELHNAKRTLHSAPSMTWNKTLEQYAQDYANKYNCNGTLIHSGGPYGENLAVGYKTDKALDAWYNEYKSYNYDNPGFTESTGHFTQVVWVNSVQLGCGVVDCGSYWGQYTICSYYPAGNFAGEFPKNVLPQVST